MNLDNAIIIIHLRISLSYIPTYLIFCCSVIVLVVAKKNGKEINFYFMTAFQHFIFLNFIL